MTARTLAASLIRRHEGCVLRIHDGTTGSPIGVVNGRASIGYGRDLTVRGISQDEAELMLTNDIIAAERIAQAFAGNVWPWLGEPRQAALIDLAHQLGEERLMALQSVQEALREARFESAASALLDSLWERQAPARAHELAELLRTGNGLVLRNGTPT